MQCYTELIPPSAVTHAVALPFLNSTTKNLVIAKTSLIQVFDLKTIKREDANDDGQPHSIEKTKLVLVGEYPVSGTITSLDAIKALNTKSGGDALLIAFKDAKLSLVEWDPENHKISTISIHYYEGENISSLPFGPSLGESENILTVDPSSRCAALKFDARNLAILPFRQLGDELMEGAEDGFDVEMDVAPPSATIKRTQSGLHEAVDGTGKQTPYKSSFVLPLTALDPALTHPVDLAFLHEYREPTFGILSATVQPSTALLETRKDILSYTVFTLDLEQRASTNLITTTKLPSDLWKVVPLPLPIGGALLVGTNELVHVDQSGKTNAVAVNEFAKAASNFGMADQSELNMKLEDCGIESLDPATGELLIVLNDGALAILSFRIQGRNVAGLKVSRVAQDQGGYNIESAPSCITALNDAKMFVGSEDGDATLVQWSKTLPTLSRKRSHAQMVGQDTAADADENEDDDLDDDDLYATTTEPVRRASSFSGSSPSDAASSYRFEVLDTLPSLGPTNDTCMGRSSLTPKGQLELYAGVGRGRGSRLACMTREIRPDSVGTSSFDNAKNGWSLSVRTAETEDEDRNYDNLFFCYDGENTSVYDIVHRDDSNNPIYSERTGTEFEHEGETLTVSTLANRTRVVQCRRTEIRTYEASDLSLSQIIPMIDDETDAELKIVHTSFCDPYLLVIRDDSSVQLLWVGESGDIEPLENDATVKERKWLSGCLHDGFHEEPVLFLLAADGGVYLFGLPRFEVFYSTSAFSYLPTVIARDLPQRRVGAKETLTELLVADIGTEDAKQPYMILRSALDDLTLYELYQTDKDDSDATPRFRKVPFSYVPKFEETMGGDDDRPLLLREMKIGRYTAVYVPGAAPKLILKEESSLPKALSLNAGSFKALTPLHHRGCERGFGIVDENGLRECQLPANAEFSSGWCVQRMKIGDPPEEVRNVAFDDAKQMYVVATCKDVDFHFPDDDGRRQDQDGEFFSQAFSAAWALCPASLRITSIYVCFFFFSWGDVYS